MTDALKGRALVVAAAILWSTGGVAIKLTSLDAMQIAAGRALPAGLAMLLLLPKARTRWDKQVWLTSLAYAATCILFVWSNTLTTAGNAIFIQNIAPVWVLLASPWALGEHATRAEKISVPISLAGCVLFFLDSIGGGHHGGNAIALCASFTYAALILRYRLISPEQNLASVVCGNTIIVVLALPFIFSGPTPNLTDISALAYLGIIQQAAAAVLFIYGIKKISAVEGALLVLLEPIFSPIWAYLLVGETLGPAALVGAGLIVCAAVGRALRRKS